MVYYKSALFTKTQQANARLFKALAHPARLAILEYLASTKTCISGDISNVLPLSRSTVNQHLKELKNARLIKGEIAGAKTNYCLNKCEIEKLEDTLHIIISELKNAAPNEC